MAVEFWKRRVASLSLSATLGLSAPEAIFRNKIEDLVRLKRTQACAHQDRASRSTASASVRAQAPRAARNQRLNSPLHRRCCEVPAWDFAASPPQRVPPLLLRPLSRPLCGHHSVPLRASRAPIHLPISLSYPTFSPPKPVERKELSRTRLLVKELRLPMQNAAPSTAISSFGDWLQIPDVEARRAWQHPSQDFFSGSDCRVLHKSPILELIRVPGSSSFGNWRSSPRSWSCGSAPAPW